VGPPFLLAEFFAIAVEFPLIRTAGIDPVRSEEGDIAQ